MNKEDNKFKIAGETYTKEEQMELYYIARIAVVGIRCRDGKIGNNW